MLTEINVKVALKKINLIKCKEYIGSRELLYDSISIICH